MHDDPLDGLQVFERGWLSSNNLLIHAAPGEAGAVLVDTGHVNHASQTVALVQQALPGRPGQKLARVLNTHLHSDHCGGNAAVQRAFGVAAEVPPGEAKAAREWDMARLSYEASGQIIERYEVGGVIEPGHTLRAGGRDWELLAAPGHDPHSLMLFDRRAGLLLSADALWENGFGVVFPEIAGEPGFDDVEATLDLISGLPVRLVLPGHGAPFTDVAGALERARSRLAGFQADPARHTRHAIKVLIKYHLMEVRSQTLPAFRQWAAATPMLVTLWDRQRPAGSADAAAWAEAMVGGLVAGGALAMDSDDNGDLIRDV